MIDTIVIKGFLSFSLSLCWLGHVSSSLVGRVGITKATKSSMYDVCLANKLSGFL